MAWLAEEVAWFLAYIVTAAAVLRGGKAVHLLILLFFAASFWGASLPGVHLGGFHLFGARLLLPAAWCATLWLLRHEEQRWKLFRSPFFYFALLWILWAGLSLIWAQDLVSAEKHLFHLLFGLSLPLVVMLLPPKQRELLPLIWVGTAIIIILLGAGQLVNAPEIPPKHQWLTAVYGNENDVSMFITLSLPLLAGYGLDKSRDSWWSEPLRIIALFSVLVGITLILMTSARLNYVALAMLAIIMPVIYLGKGTKGKKKIILAHRDVLAISIVIILAVSSLFFIPKVNARVKEHLYSIPREVKSVLSGDVSNARARLTLSGINLVRYSRGLGVGPGNFEHHLAEYANLGTINPHNWWLELLAEYGVLVFLAYCGIFIYLIITVSRRWKQDGHWAAGAILASLVVFPILAVAPSRLIWYPPHWLLLAVATSLASEQGSPTFSFL